MAERPRHNPYTSEKAGRQAQGKRLVIVIGLLAGAIFALLLRRYMGWQ